MIRPTVMISLGSEPLVEATFLERPNRFLIRAALLNGGGPVEAHLPDPGRLREILVPGARLFLRPAAGKHRRTRWTLTLAESPGGEGLVSLDTTLPNRLVHKALESSALPEFREWTLERAEATVGGSRFDFLLRGPSQLLVEVKSVTLVEDGVGLFPDAVTARGTRHVRELSSVARKDGWDAAVLFILRREDGREIRAAPSIDPAFAEALSEAREAGVRVLGRRCRVSLEGVELGDPLPAG